MSSNSDSEDENNGRIHPKQVAVGVFDVTPFVTHAAPTIAATVALAATQVIPVAASGFARGTTNELLQRGFNAIHSRLWGNSVDSAAPVHVAEIESPTADVQLTSDTQDKEIIATRISETLQARNAVTITLSVPTPLSRETDTAYNPLKAQKHLNRYPEFQSVVQAGRKGLHDVFQPINDRVKETLNGFGYVIEFESSLLTRGDRQKLMKAKQAVLDAQQRFQEAIPTIPETFSKQFTESEGKKATDRDPNPLRDAMERGGDMIDLHLEMGREAQLRARDITNSMIQDNLNILNTTELQSEISDALRGGLQGNQDMLAQEFERSLSITPLTMLTNPLQAIRAALSKVFDVIMAIIKPIIQSILKMFARVMNNTVAIVKTGTDNIIQTSARVAEGIKKGFKELKEALAKIMAQLNELYQNASTVLWESVPVDIKYTAGLVYNATDSVITTTRTQGAKILWWMRFLLWDMSSMMYTGWYFICSRVMWDQLAHMLAFSFGLYAHPLTQMILRSFLPGNIVSTPINVAFLATSFIWSWTIVPGLKGVSRIVICLWSRRTKQSTVTAVRKTPTSTARLLPPRHTQTSRRPVTRSITRAVAAMPRIPYTPRPFPLASLALVVQ